MFEISKADVSIASFSKKILYKILSFGLKLLNMCIKYFFYIIAYI